MTTTRLYLNIIVKIGLVIMLHEMFENVRLLTAFLWMGGSVGVIDHVPSEKKLL